MSKQPAGVKLLQKYKAENDLTIHGLADAITAARPDIVRNDGTPVVCKHSMARDLLYGERRPSIAMAAKLQRLLGTTASDWFPDPE